MKPSFAAPVVTHRSSLVTSIVTTELDTLIMTIVKVKGTKSYSGKLLTTLILRYVIIIISSALILVLAFSSLRGKPTSSILKTPESSLVGKTTTTTSSIHKLSNYSGETVSLRNSDMPAIGYGTCCRQTAKGEAIYTSTLAYLNLGGRLIDTAMAYRNHVEIGRAVRDSGLARDSIWITGKVAPNAVKGKGKDVYKETMDAIDTMLQELNVGSYLDLCLIHSPKLGQKDTIKMWKALVKNQNEGKIRSIGVSNFNKQEILDLQASTGTLPEVNQIQYHPWTSPEWKMLVQWQIEMGIVTTAYNSLGGSKFHSSNRGNKWPSAITQQAQLHKVTEAQLLLRWAIQQEKVAVIPGATSEAHIRDNLSVPQFTLDLGALEQADVPPKWFDAKRGPVKYKAEEATDRAWTGDHTIPKKRK